MTGVQQEDVGRVALAGDWHGNRGFAYRAIKAAHDRGAEGILQLGDFGIWPGVGGEAFLSAVNTALGDFGMWLAFIDGNHEDHWALGAMPVVDGVRPVDSRITHLPRGYRWTWHGKTWLALGGATSLDRHLRTIGVSWWPEEAITGAQAEKAIADGPVDIMVTHDAPLGAKVPGLDPSKWRMDALAEAHAHRTLLRMIVEEVRPKRLFHGHMHVAYQDWLPVDLGCEVRGLASDGEGLQENLMVVDPMAL